MYAYDNISLSPSLEWEMFQEILIEKIKTRI